ncbi:MAG: serine hydrolase [Blastocatellia bacterium]|nr:serine hydrolase [Blastocatellia bacterium]
MRTQFLFAILLFAAMASAVMGQAPSACAYDFSPVTTIVQDAVGRVPLAGASLVLIKDGRVVYERQFGAYDANTTVFIASASKWIAAATLMTLVDEGKLGLDDPVSKYLPYFTGEKGTMTIRQLFSHTSGLPPDIALGSESGCLGDRGTTLDGCVREIAGLALIGPPGGQFAYGGNSMQVAGRICEVVSGKSWEALFQERIAGPLGMTGTTFGTSQNPLVAGGARSRLGDYAAFLRMILNEGLHDGRRILSAEAVREMQRDQTFGVPIVFSPHTQYGNGSFRYGLGEWIDAKDGQGNSIQLSSQGGFGFSPWIDRRRNLIGVLLVQNSLQNVYRDVERVQRSVREILDGCPLVGVQVNQGSGDGSYEVGKTVHIWADPSPAGKVFDRWAGATHVLADPLAAHTTLVVPAGPVNVTALYKDARAWTPTVETINGVNVAHYIPQPHVGVVFRFHGTGGSAAGQFNGAENAIFNGDLIAAGYGIVALDSLDRVNRQWSPVNTLDNPDLKNVQAVIAALVARGGMAAGDPLFAYGVSNGGGFSSRVSVLLNFRAGAISIAAGIGAFLEAGSVPFTWNLAQNDDNEGVGAEGNARALQNYNALRARGIAAQYLVNPPSPVYPQRFARISGLTPADSQTIYNSLKTGGFLDEGDFLRQNPQTSNWASAIPSQYGAQRTAIGEQLDVCYARHNFYSDYSNKVAAFFNARLATTTQTVSVLAPSYSDAALAGESIAAAFGAGFANGAVVAATTPLPVDLGGTTIRVRDSASVERFAPLFFVSPTQINYLVPAGTAAGRAQITIANGQGLLAVGTSTIEPVAPGLFTADASGRGLAAATILRIKQDGSQVYEAVARFDAAQNRFVPVPVDLGNANEQVFLILFATGIRNRSQLANVTARIGDVDAPVLFAGPQGGLVGLDQVNVQLPRALAGKGEAEILLTVDGRPANLVRIAIK